MHDLHINWRGPLASCNYDCAYCPFAKHVSSRAELDADREALARFVEWCESPEARARQLSIRFTPWGEALIRPHYATALVALSHLPQVRAVAIQTNLSARLEPLAEADLEALSLWTTFHPSETSLAAFVGRCAILDALGVRYSVGVVGLREHFELIEALRAALRPEVYLWVNAYKSAGPGYYAVGDEARLAAIDPLFEFNARRHSSRGQACGAGQTALFVRGDGRVSRCHFVDEALGNLYRDSLATMLGERVCPVERCGCFIGYVHLDSLGLRGRFGDGLAGRMLPVLPG